MIENVLGGGKGNKVVAAALLWGRQVYLDTTVLFTN